ncbi:MAG: hypothetical protein ACE5IA_01070 [Dehalococcoidia bacterium]
MGRRRHIRIIVLVLVLLAGGVLRSDMPYPASSFEGVAAPHLFSIAAWEAKNLIDMGKARIGRLFDRSPAEDRRAVEDYYHQAQQIYRLEWERGQRAGNRGQLEKELARAKTARARLEDRAEAVVEGQIGSVLAQEGLSLLRGGRPLLPPLAFEFDSPPHILVTSPRERIALKKVALLGPGLTLKEIEGIEARVERLGDSALVERLGGIATYPSLVPETSTLEDALSTIAHEWLHHYLFFRPLGRGYGQNREMTTINETAASMGGKEIAQEVLRRYWGKEPKKEEEKPPGAFDFNREMHSIRLGVDAYLARGQVEEAERFMEERRNYLLQNGYYIRRLNQAYFAYHGTYADTPASTSPIGPQLKTLRQRSASLGEFIRMMSQISSYEELKSMVGEG